jgi:HEPN domain-containing protein
MIEGWINKASNHLDTAKEHLKSGIWDRMSDSIQASQVCVELSVKAILNLLEIPYPTNHGWDRKELAGIAKDIKERDLLNRLASHCLAFIVPLPRLLFRANFWSKFYLEAKYGFEAEHLAPAQALFEKEDAELAVKHANDCLGAARALLYHPKDQLAALIA